MYNSSLLITSPAHIASDIPIDFLKGATRARFVAQKLPLENLRGPFEVPLSCSVKYQRVMRDFSDFLIEWWN